MHPFHTLAAELAQQAVLQVSLAMRWCWDGHSDADPAALAANYLKHPYDTHWHDERVRRWARAQRCRIRNFRIGVGYDFSDDLTGFDYKHRGWFVNLVGSY